MSTSKLRLLLLALAICLGAGLSEADAQRRHGSSPLETLGEEVSQAEGLKILEQYRRVGVAGDYRLNFQLRIMPRREKTTTVSGLLLGTMTAYGPLTRIDVALEPADIADNGDLIPAKTKRLLLQNGLFANVLEVDSENGYPEELAPIPSERYFDRIAGSDFTVFDLLMPFTFWQRFEYEGRTKMRGRPTHVFSLYPPEDDAALTGSVSKVRIYLDEEFSALIRVEVFDASEEKTKTIEMVSFKLVDGQAVLSQVDVRNEEARDKTRFKVLDAAIGVELPEWVFDIEGLARNVYGTELATVPALKGESEESE